MICWQNNRLSQKFITLFMLLLLSFEVSHAEIFSPSQAPDWNKEKINWYNYEQGIQQSQISGKPMMLILYANWCSTCHAYQYFFKSPQVIELSSQLTMIRVNVDEYPHIEQRYNLDGEYVPRIFGLFADKSLMKNIHSNRTIYHYFLSTEDFQGFITLMKGIIATSSSHR